MALKSKKYYLVHQTKVNELELTIVRDRTNIFEIFHIWFVLQIKTSFTYI